MESRLYNFFLAYEKKRVLKQNNGLLINIMCIFREGWCFKIKNKVKERYESVLEVKNIHVFFFNFLKKKYIFRWNL